MTRETNDYCRELLSAMISPTQPWTDAVALLYAITMREWPDHVARAAVEHAALNCKWRPSPPELRQIALTAFVKTPNLSQVLEEARRFVIWHHPTERKANEHKLHPVTRYCLDLLGGWENWAMQNSEDTPAAFARVLPAAVEEWHAKEALTLLQSIPAPEPSAGHIATAANPARAIEGAKRR